MNSLFRQCWSRWKRRAGPRCLRCKDSVLTTTGKGSDICFYACPQCQRVYAKSTHGPVVFQWGHPISLALYPVIFDRHPLTRVEDVARWVLGSTSSDWKRLFIQEVALELREPTQPLRKMLPGILGAEQELREYLRGVASYFSSTLGQRGLPSDPNRPAFVADEHLSEVRAKSQTIDLLFKRVREEVTREDYLAWATDLLASGYDAPGIVMIASDAEIESSQRERLLAEILPQLGFRTPANPGDFIAILEEKMLQEYSAGKISGRQLVVRCAEFWRLSEYADRFRIWNDLDEDIRLTEDGYGPIFHPLTKTELEEGILKALRSAGKIR